MGREERNKIFIECECGAHLLQLISDVEYFDDTVSKKTRVRQEFEFAMFSYGDYHKKLSFWRRLGIIFNYLKTGKMHEDQMILTPEEAQKLADFINDNIIAVES